jgi:VIT1/CCC1 family predicted Fe2+/Mn2+ transporter
MKKKEMKKYLSLSDRWTEIITGIIMTTAVIGATRIGIGSGHTDFLIIFSAAIGCDIAWGLVDGVLYIFGELTDRGRHVQLLKNLKAIEDQDNAVDLVIKKIDQELDPPILEHFNHEDKVRISQGVVKFSSKMTPENVHISKKDVFGGITIFFLDVVAGLVLLIPFFFLPTQMVIAARISMVIALILLFIIGYQWAKIINRPKIQTGLIIMFLAIAIDVIVIILGG